MDSSLLAAVVDELRTRLTDRPVTKVETVGRTGVLLRFAGERESLWLSAHPELSRIGLVPAPPSLHVPRRAGAALGEVLHEAKLIGIDLEEGGRVATFRFTRESARHGELLFVAELIPRFANLILIGDGGMVLWSRREFPGAGRSREIRPGARYVPPAPLAPRPGAPANVPPGVGASAHVDREFRAREIDEEKAQLRSALRRVLVRRRAKAAKALRHVERRLEDAREEPLIRRHGELLAAHLGSVRRGMDRIVVPDFDGSASIAIPLDPKLDPQGNLDEIFRRARRLARANEDLVAQQSIQEAAIAEADDTVARLEAGIPDDALLALAARFLDDAELGAATASGAKVGDSSSTGAGSKTARGPALPAGFVPRRYVLPGGWEVWVGRSAAQNDVLTHKVASPRDLWFHARGAQGSHTVLRLASGKGEPPKSVIEAAAAIAAFHSKARNSKLVPVAYTERRFVRRPRGAPVGTASIQREKVIFVEPAVPHEAPESGA